MPNPTPISDEAVEAVARESYESWAKSAGAEDYVVPWDKLEERGLTARADYWRVQGRICLQAALPAIESQITERLKERVLRDFWANPEIQAASASGATWATVDRALTAAISTAMGEGS